MIASYLDGYHVASYFAHEAMKMGAYDRVEYWIGVSDNYRNKIIKCLKANSSSVSLEALKII